MADGLGNVTEKVTTIAKTLHEHIAEGNCTDHKGQFIPNGLLYTPRGADACRVCTCASGDPILCRTVLCAPPTHCNSIKVPDQCCHWVCLEELHPVGGKTDNGDQSGGGPVINVRYTPGNGADIGLRLVASSVTAILSLCLLFFLVYRLRRRSQRRSLRNRNNQQHVLQNSMQPDQQSIDSITITAIDQYETNRESHQTSRNLGGYFPFWWKPRDATEQRREPPPSYDQTMNEAIRGGVGVRSLEDDDNYSTDSYGSEAPSYSDIYHDPVIHQPTPPCPPPSRMQAGISLPLGAALVLPSPAPPLSQLHHVPSPRWDGSEEQHNLQRNDLNNSFDGNIQSPFSNADNSNSRTFPHARRYLQPGRRRNANSSDRDVLDSSGSATSQIERNSVLEEFSLQLSNPLPDGESSRSGSSLNSSSSTLSPIQNHLSAGCQSSQRPTSPSSNSSMNEDTDHPCTNVYV